MPTTHSESTMSSGTTKPGTEDPSHHVGKVEASGDSAKLKKLYAPPHCWNG